MILDGYSHHHQRMNVSLCGVHLNCHFFFKPASQRERAWLVCHVQPICNDNICVSTLTTILLALLAGTIFITKTFLLLTNKRFWKCSIIQIPTGLNGYRRNWTPKDHPIKCCSISYILDLHGSGIFVLLFVIIISNANMIYARPNTCLGMIWNKISRRSQDIRADP